MLKATGYALPAALQVAELNAKVQELETQFNVAVEDKEAAIRESERCQLKLQLANRLINALASEGGLVARNPILFTLAS